MNCELMLPATYTSPPLRRCPLILSGGNPSFSRYSISAPNTISVSTRGWMGRSCIRLLPLMIHSPSIPARKAVRKRMAVPAPFTSNRFESELNESMITCVSSQSDRAWIGVVLRLNAFRIRALLLMLFDAGRCTVVRTLSGGLIRYCCCITLFFSTKLIILPEGATVYLAF